MKKLLIAMTAAAVGTCAWADGVTYLNAAPETFANWANGTDGYVTSVAAPWSYGTVADNADGDSVVTAADPAADELKVVDGVLSLNTGSKVLRGAFAESDVTIPADGLYFSSKVTFKDPSDTLPTLGAKDKFALVVLDNVESIENKVATTPSTNLFVIAKYGTNETRAYELNIAIDEEWLGRSHNIEVKAYNNVMKNGTCAGFLVWVDNKVCKVLYSYAIEQNVINFTNGALQGGVFAGESGDGIGYLGVTKAEIAASMELRYTNQELLLSCYAGDSTLTSVDFQGQGDVDDVALKTEATYATFGTDSLVFTVEGTVGGVTITSDETVAYAAAGETKNITFTLADGWVLKGVAKDLTPGVNGVYTYVYTTVADNNQVVKIEAYKPAAYIGDTPYESFTLALAAGGTIKLAQNVAENITIAGNKTIVLDLNGFDIEGSNASRATIVSDGNLTITNSVADKGSVVATAAGSVVNNGGVLNVQAGTFTGLVKVDGYNDEFGSADASVTVTGGTFDGAFTVVTPAEDAGYKVTATVTGGKFLTSANNTVADLLDTDNYELDTTTENGYSIVVAKSEDADNFESSKEVVNVEGATAEDAENVDAALEEIAAAIGDGAGDTEVKAYLDKFYTSENKVTAAILAGALNNETIGLSVKYNLPLMEETPVIDVTTEAADATNDESAAFSFQIKVKGNALSVAALEEALDTVRTMIEYGTDLKQMGQLLPANPDVDLAVDTNNNKIKVKMKNTQSKGFMKVKLSK